MPASSSSTSSALPPRLGSGTSGPGGAAPGLSSYPTPLQGPLRPLRTPSGTGSERPGTAEGRAGSGLGSPGSALRPGSGGLSPWGSTSTPRSPAVGAEETQDRIREENRARAAAGSDALLSAQSQRPVRPMSGNKKFLGKYNLDRHNLFAP